VKGLMSLTLLMSMTSFAAGVLQEKQIEPVQGAAMPMMQMMQDCPMNIPGVEVAVVDTPTGIAVSLTTKSGNVNELRRRVERMAAMHTGPMESSPGMPGKMMPGLAKYEAIPNGARLTLTPKDPAQLTEFRKQVRAHVERMTKEGGCSMTQGMMGGMSKAATEAEPEPKPEPKKEEDGAVEHKEHHPEGGTK